MKNLLLAVILTVMTLAASAQIPKGTSTLGGSISLSYQEKKNGGSDKYKTTTVDLSPGYGLFIIDNLCIGVNAGVSSSRGGSSQKFQGQELNNNSRSINAGPFVRYYLPINSKLYAFGHAGYMWKWNKIEYETFFDSSDIISLKGKNRSNSWNAGAGLSYFLTPNVALEGMLGYTGYRYKDSRDGGINFILAEKSGSLALDIGFRLFLRKNS